MGGEARALREVGGPAAPLPGRGRGIGRAGKVGPSARRCQGADSSRKAAAAAAPRSLLTSPPPVRRRAPASSPQKFAPSPARWPAPEPLAPGSRAPRRPPRWPPPRAWAPGDSRQLRSGAAARTGAGDGRAPQCASGRAGVAAAAAARAAQASREQALWPTPYRTPINLEATADKVCKDRFLEVDHWSRL